MNRSKIRLGNSIGLTSVMRSSQHTSDAAALPRAGPTGIPWFLDQRTMSLMTRK
jgi:hypothetical protein